MSEKDFQMLMELAQKHLQEKVSKEEAFRSLVQCGLLDEEGNLTLTRSTSLSYCSSRQ